MVEVHQARDPATVWMHRIRSLVLTEADGRLSGLALIMQDVSEHYEAEERFESMFRANPAPAVVVPAFRPSLREGSTRASST